MNALYFLYERADGSVEVVVLPGGPRLMATTSGEQAPAFEIETAMSDGADTSPVTQTSEWLAGRDAQTRRDGFQRVTAAQIDIPVECSVDSSEHLLTTAKSAALAPIAQFRSIQQAQNVLMTQMRAPLAAQPRTQGRRRVAVAERQAMLRVEGDTEPLLRPNGETYLCRSLMGHSDKAALLRAREVGLFALLGGPPGSGKSALADAVFPDLVSYSCTGETTVANLVGSLQPTPEGGWEWVDGPLTIAVRQGLPLLLDEVDRLPYEVMPILHPLMDGRRLLRLDDNPAEPVLTAADGFYIVGTYNPGMLGGQPLPDALLSRFTLRVHVSTDLGAAQQMGVPEQFVRLAENLHRQNTPSRGQQAPVAPIWEPQMRELLVAKRLIDAGFGEPFALSSLIDACPIEEDRPRIRQAAATIFGTPERDIAPVALGEQVV